MFFIKGASGASWGNLSTQLKALLAQPSLLTMDAVGEADLTEAADTTYTNNVIAKAYTISATKTVTCRNFCQLIAAQTIDIEGTLTSQGVGAQAPASSGSNTQAGTAGAIAGAGGGARTGQAGAAGGASDQGAGGAAGSGGTPANPGTWGLDAVARRFGCWQDWALLPATYKPYGASGATSLNKTGGPGAGSIILLADTITIGSTGVIDARGTSPTDSTGDDAGAGAGAAGIVIAIARVLAGTGAVKIEGAKGGNGHKTTVDAGGGAGSNGGWLLTSGSNSSCPWTVTKTGGAGGTKDGPTFADGAAGNDGTATHIQQV